jgi:hypothetical protein
MVSQFKQEQTVLQTQIKTLTKEPANTCSTQTDAPDSLFTNSVNDTISTVRMDETLGK